MLRRYLLQSSERIAYAEVAHCSVKNEQSYQYGQTEHQDSLKNVCPADSAQTAFINVKCDSRNDDQLSEPERDGSVAHHIKDVAGSDDLYQRVADDCESSDDTAEYAEERRFESGADAFGLRPVAAFYSQTVDSRRHQVA